MALGKTYLIIPILFGIGLIIYQKKNVKEFLPDFYDPKESFFGIPGIDNIFALQISFFRQYLNDPTSVLLNHTLFPLAMVNMFIIAVEGSVPGVNGLVTYYSLVAAISVFVAISIAVPLIWIPAWIISENRKGYSSNPDDVTLNPKRVKRICLGILLTLPFLIGMSIFKQDKLIVWTVISFVFSFLFAALFWVWYPKGVNPDSVNQNAYELASKFALILFGISFYEWFLVLEHSIDNNFEVLIGTITQIISGITYSATDFMIVDTWGLIAASAYWIFVAENGKFNRKFWKFIGQSILCGPGGALALYVYHRYDGMINKDVKKNTNNQPSSSRLMYTNDERRPLLK
ncbi:hypothetical protein RhiirA5_502866 [Rhizophagus irregularis]|uniref:Uncharacterized protein n=3 Tax=Rhizophagus irregularis TaxID=588596 RepID=A0A2I1GXY1_9GLOM|nr:hypothetical protein GLOIN_2v1564725 [Rhizophagus irregularis DAOM 181602=DAOM 197198]PKC04310.1 hypothetical protein RhiirA5_502866 [Rhizophagus irregularis]PKC60149.1 hypothetical protein RhiirA1_540044 [Rhizophagus irregularis]PKY51489.1 hypothetical protein RhiirA4_546585 [Rhizophagus irregularis]POG75426.1 hypothetical protein GLOIN_2v1564725 [Rhizophagus irregularis DAOM 181602=DAOM 197198]UZO09314.1 hypothetical protein OCT59_029546 [Rhizophagus irregularis]|eukprot:XP_025182292.1 hypothetical protein GLOIN_2v1564725 [Rhizophagus irregularis DAOM 181602=DAOM 197198]